MRIKIATVSLNPSIDQTVWIDNLRVNAVNRSRSIQLEPGGKGVNVAVFLAGYARCARLDLEIAATGFLGRENVQLHEQRFAGLGIADHFVRLPGQTRTCVKIVDEAAQQTTDINLPGLEPSPKAVEQLLETIERLAADAQWFVLTGSLPPGLPDSFYAELIARLRSHGRKIILDTSQAALREGVRACPAIIKPNRVELHDLTGRETRSQADLLAAVHPLLASGIEMVVVSLGEDGAIFATPDTVLQTLPPRVPVKSTVGAGDALVAGLLCAQVQGLPLADCARLATAFSVAAITQTTRGLPPLKLLEDFLHQVRIEEI